MKLINKLKPYALSLGLGLGALINDGCASLGTLGFKKEHQRPEIRLVSFQDYSPIPQRKELNLEDKMLEIYLSQAYDINELRSSILNRHLVDDIETDPVKTLEITHFGRFKEGVVSTAAELGYSEDDIRNLSIQDALMLSGKIVAERLEYNQGMISKEETEFFDRDPEVVAYSLLFEAIKKMSGKKVMDLRNDEAKRIDSASEDSIFFDGAGVCRNYAGVNSAVFEVLKSINPNLRNTYMRWYTPEDLGHALALPHAWNQVSTIIRDGKDLEILITYVDPTWLDTRNKTVSNTGEKLDADERDLYEGLDESHFGADALHAERYLAKLYETLGDDSRTVSRTFGAAREETEYYLRQGFDKRMEICDRILDIAEDNPENFEKFDNAFGESFQIGAENLMRNYTHIILEYGHGSIYPLDRSQFGRLSEVYERALNVVPDYVKKENLEYTRLIKDSRSAVLEKISVEKLYDKIKEEFSKN